MKPAHTDVVIIGLGYIGLPTAALLASKGLSVHGVDINPGVVEAVNSGATEINEPGLDALLKRAIDSGKLVATTKPVESDIFLIVVPTPFRGKHEPDTSFVEAALDEICPLLKEDDLVIVESTCPVGTTENLSTQVNNARPDLTGKVSICYCPERVLPGNIIHELKNNDRIIGGISPKAASKAAVFYRKFVDAELYQTNARTAELCKLAENSCRDVQIAFANELSLICHRAGIDVWELIELANKHPRINILRPGCGVGGHCIAVDPYFLVTGYPQESKLIGKAREINHFKAIWCTERIKDACAEFRRNHQKRPRLALLGLAFKPNVDDLRQSPAKFIAQEVLRSVRCEEVFIVEPNLDEHRVYKLTTLETAITKADLIVILVPHREFCNLSLPPEKIVIDFCGATADINTRPSPTKEEPQTA